MQKYFTLYLFNGNKGLVLQFLKFFFFFLNLFFFIDSFIILHNILIQYKIPFIFRAIKIAGRSYELPMLTFLTSQYKFLFRIFFKLLHFKKTFNFFTFFVSFILRSLLNQSYLFETYEKNLEIAASNQRFLRFRWK